MHYKLDQTVQHKPSQKKLVVISNDILIFHGEEYLICRDDNYSIDKYKLNEIEEFKDQIDEVIKYVQNNHCEIANTPCLLLGNVAELIKILTGKDVDWNDLKLKP